MESGRRQCLKQRFNFNRKTLKLFTNWGKFTPVLKRAEDSRTVLEKFKQLSKAEKEKKEVEREKLVKRLVNVRF
jgi:hypothetical protein